MTAKKTTANDTASAPQNAQGPGGRQVLLLLMAVGLVALFAGSLVYRAKHPSLTQHVEHTGSQQGGGQAMSGASMEMIKALMAKLEENPKDVHVLHTLGEQFMRMKAWDRAKALLERGLSVEPANKQILRLLGLTEFNMEHYAEAAEKFETVVALEPGDYISHYNLGIVYAHFLEKPEKAREHFEAVANGEGVPDESRKEAQEQLKHLH
ncbi:hypothetical protein JCM16814_09470 [Desulfobaculum senezii]|jgi:tetratricopeptide (TPR) repeat protein